MLVQYLNLSRQDEILNFSIDEFLNRADPRLEDFLVLNHIRFFLQTFVLKMAEFSNKDIKMATNLCADIMLCPMAPF